jgi:hypothetical protein
MKKKANNSQDQSTVNFKNVESVTYNGKNYRRAPEDPTVFVYKNQQSDINSYYNEEHRINEDTIECLVKNAMATIDIVVEACGKNVRNDDKAINDLRDNGDSGDSEDDCRDCDDCKGCDGDVCEDSDEKTCWGIVDSYVKIHDKLDLYIDLYTHSMRKAIAEQSEVEPWELSKFIAKHNQITVYGNIIKALQNIRN